MSPKLHGRHNRVAIVSGAARGLGVSTPCFWQRKSANSSPKDYGRRLHGLGADQRVYDEVVNKIIARRV